MKITFVKRSPTVCTTKPPVPCTVPNAGEDPSAYFVSETLTIIIITLTGRGGRITHGITMKHIVTGTMPDPTI